MMVSANALQRTLCIRRGDRIGTAFTVDRGGRQYIVTAHHVVRDITSGDVLAVRRNRVWGEVHIRVVGMDAEADIAVLAHEDPLTPNHQLEMAGPGSWFHSQSVAFLGFPFGWDSGTESINNGYPVPFIKAGIISANVEGPPRRIYVDAHGNPGFSGGPLVLRLLGQPLTVPVVVAGVIIDLPLDPITAEQTGLVCATSIEHVVSLIDASPLDGRP